MPVAGVDLRGYAAARQHIQRLASSKSSSPKPFDLGSNIAIEQHACPHVHHLHPDQRDINRRVNVEDTHFDALNALSSLPHLRQLLGGDLAGGFGRAVGHRLGRWLGGGLVLGFPRFDCRLGLFGSRCGFLGRRL